MLTNRHVNTQVQESTTRYYSSSIGKAKKHQRANAICWKLGCQGTTSSCRGRRPHKASGGIINHNRRKSSIYRQTRHNNKLMLEIRDTKKQPDL
jgi:hypothetical protein